MVNSVLPVLNMSCASCAANIELKLKNIKGVYVATVNVATRMLSVEFDENIISLEIIRDEIVDIGYDLIIEADEDLVEDIQKKELRNLKWRVIVAWILSAIIMVLSMMHIDFEWVNLLLLILTIPVMAYSGRAFYINAWKQLKHKSSNMDTLVALSTAVAFLFSLFNTIIPDFLETRGLESHVYYEAATMIIAFVLLGKFLEEKAKSSTASAIKGLMGLQPKVATLVTNDGEREVLIVTLNEHDNILVKPGERIPVDGVVIKGSSFVDESMISGEPIPVEKQLGDKLLAGTINQNGILVFEAKSVGDKTILAQIIRMVQQAQGSKAPVQKIVDKISSVFVPTIILLSILTFILWLVIGGSVYFSNAILSAISVLVIACPCALGLATPTALMVGIGKAAEKHILIKDATALENMCKVDAVVLDKTGTLTQGKPSVSELEWAVNISKEDKGVLMSLEEKSEHPLSNAIVERLSEEEDILHIDITADITNFKNIVGKGIQATFKNITYWVGNIKMSGDYGAVLDMEVADKVYQWQNQGKTVAIFGKENKILSIIAISDLLKETSLVAVERLKALNIDVYMLTGDSELSAKYWSSKLGIENFKAGVLPQDKENFIKELQSQGRIVAMIGDGINDSQALVSANVGVAMGKGADIAMDAAMITLITSDLMLLPEAIQLSRRTVRMIYQNLFWAFIYNIIGIPIAAGVLFAVNGLLFEPMWASAAMAFSSVSVVLNSLRLKRSK